MEFTDNGIKLSGDEAQVFGAVVEMSGYGRFPTQETTDAVKLRQIIRPFGFFEPHDVEIVQADFETVLRGANIVLAHLDVAAQELSRDPVGDPMPLSADALRSLVTTVEIRNAMANVLYDEQRVRRIERYKQIQERP